MQNKDMLMVKIWFLFIIHAYNKLRCVMKRHPTALAFLFVLQSVLIFLCFLLITHYVMINNLLIHLQ